MYKHRQSLIEQQREMRRRVKDMARGGVSNSNAASANYGSIAPGPSRSQQHDRVGYSGDSDNEPNLQEHEPLLIHNYTY